MRRGNDVRVAHERRLRVSWLAGDTSRPAPPTWLSPAPPAARPRRQDRRGPRSRTAPRLHRRELGRAEHLPVPVMQESAAYNGVGLCQQVRQLVRATDSSTSGGPPSPGRARTPSRRGPNGARRRASATPIAPRPTMSTVASSSDCPTGRSGQRRSISTVRDSSSRRASASRCSTASSAQLSALPPASPGTRATERRAR